MGDNDSVTVKSDKAAYNLLNQFKDDIINAIDAATTDAKDDEEREILVGLICGAARHSHDNHRPKAVEKAKGA